MKNYKSAERLKEAMHNRGIIAESLALESGVSKASISQYLNGHHAPSNINAGKMAEVLRVNPVWLMGFDVPKHQEATFSEPACTSKAVSAIRIPILGRVAAGIPFDAIEEVIDYEEISADMARTGEYFGLQIKGDSMEPAMSNGDTVIVRRQDDATDGEYVIAIVNGDEGCCKKLKKYENGTIALISLNPAYPPMFFTEAECDETPVRIVGKVKELRRSFI